MKRISQQAERVLGELDFYGRIGVTTAQISKNWAPHLPQPSVRRAVGELKAAGYGISRIHGGKRIALSALKPEQPEA